MRRKPEADDVFQIQDYNILKVVEVGDEKGDTVGDI